MPEIEMGQDGSFESSADVAAEQGRIDEARAELYDEVAGSTESDGGELILGKYKSTEDLAAAYQSLQAEYSKLKNGQAPEPTKAESEPEAKAPEPDKQGEGGGLAPEQVEAIRSQMFEQAGGEQQYKRLASWASQNLPAERVNAFNGALEGGDTGAILNQLKGLQYDFMMANGYEPKLSGGRAPSNEIKGYSSEAQVIAAMNDPRYSGNNPDPAYIKEVERRIAVSNVFQAG